MPQHRVKHVRVVKNAPVPNKDLVHLRVAQPGWGRHLRAHPAAHQPTRVAFRVVLNVTQARLVVPPEASQVRKRSVMVVRLHVHSRVGYGNLQQIISHVLRTWVVLKEPLQYFGVEHVDAG